MATLYITEAQKIGDGPSQGGTAQAMRLPAIAEQTVAIGATSAQSAAFNAKTNIVRVHTDAACHILVGPDPTATTGKLRMPADSTEYLAVTPGDKIAVIAAS